ncbi:MAG: hypothetical protein ACYCWE_14100 [Eubacteriales bacterium]
MKIIKIIKDKKGAALFTALIIIAVAATLSTALFAYSSNSILSASAKEDSKQIEFLARSGIESAIKVWDTITDKKEFKSYPVFLKSDGTYRGSSSNATTLQDDEIGYYTVEIDPSPIIPAGAPSDLILFTSTAHMNGQTLTKKAYLTETMSGFVDASNWYTDEGKLIPGKLHENDISYSIASVSGLLKKNDETLLWGSCNDTGEIPCTLDHILYFKTPSSKALNIDSDQKCMFIGKTIFFNMGINFTISNSKEVGFVVFSAAEIIVTGDINLIVNETGNGCINTVILKTHPEIQKYLDSVITSSGIKKMGKIYFIGDVYVSQYFHGTEQSRIKVISSGDAYYFDGITEDGFDFTKFAADLYLNNGSGNSGSRAIKAIYNEGLGDTYGSSPDDYLYYISSEVNSTPPVINTTRLIIWQN